MVANAKVKIKLPSVLKKQNKLKNNFGFKDLCSVKRIPNVNLPSLIKEHSIWDTCESDFRLNTKETVDTELSRRSKPHKNRVTVLNRSRLEAANQFEKGVAGFKKIDLRYSNAEDEKKRSIFTLPIKGGETLKPPHLKQSKSMQGKHLDTQNILNKKSYSDRNNKRVDLGSLVKIHNKIQSLKNAGYKQPKKKKFLKMKIKLLDVKM